MATDQCINTLEGHASYAAALVEPPDGKLASASHKTIKIWDMAKGQCEQTLPALGRGVSGLVALAGGGRVGGRLPPGKAGVDGTLHQFHHDIGGHTRDDRTCLIFDNRLPKRLLILGFWVSSVTSLPGWCLSHPIGCRRSASRFIETVPHGNQFRLDTTHDAGVFLCRVCMAVREHEAPEAAVLVRRDPVYLPA